MSVYAIFEHAPVGAIVAWSDDTPRPPEHFERPAVGSVRVFDRAGDTAELVHLAPHRTAAAQWLSEHSYPSAVLDEVTPDEASADAVEGRPAA